MREPGSIVGIAPPESSVPAVENFAAGYATPPSRWREFWRAFSQNRGALIGLTLVALLLVLAIAADVIAPHSPNEQFRESTLAPPMWHAEGTRRFILGTDPVGRDIVIPSGVTIPARTRYSPGGTPAMRNLPRSSVDTAGKLLSPFRVRSTEVCDETACTLTSAAGAPSS